MNPFAAPKPSRKLLAPLAAALLCLALASPALAADDLDVPKDGPKGATVTVLKAAKFCFPAIVEASGIIVPREETMVRAERVGLKVAEILAEPGDTVTAGQNLARLALPEGGAVMIQAPVAGLIASSTAVIGALASPRGEALFSIIARSEFDLVGQVPTEYLAKLAVNQTARVKIIGVGRGRRQGPPRRPHRRSQQPARPGVRRPHHQPPAVREFKRPRDDQDRRELRRVGAAHRACSMARPAPWCRWCGARGSKPGGSRWG